MSKAENESLRPTDAKPALPAPPNRDQLWATAAFEGELEKLANLPEGENINKGDSALFASLVKIAAVMKGTGSGHLAPAETVEAIKAVCRAYPWFTEKEIERQWRNAYRYAEPRYRRD